MNATEHDCRMIATENLSRTVEDLEQAGYRLLMIKPADSPREALFTLDRETVRVVRIDKATQTDSDIESTCKSDWTVGRARMMYRDLIPDRLGGKLIASHIRIVDGGPVDDRVHYHKIDFQIIYCLKGAIKLVYEDQGDPFWLMPGDCVLQPPEIRHRVIEAAAGSEVIEITSPVEHETWFDHELELPNASTSPDRSFNAQSFVHHQAPTDVWNLNIQTGNYESVTAIGKAGIGSPQVTALRVAGNDGDKIEYSDVDGIFVQVLIDDRGIALTQKLDLNTSR